MERSSPASTSRALTMARRLRRSGLNTNAATVLENHVKELPRDERAWAALGVLYDELGLPEKAHDAYQVVDEIRARAVSPRDKLVASINAQKKLARRFESTPVSSMSDDASAIPGDSAVEPPQSFGLTKGRAILESLREESANLWEEDKLPDIPAPDQSYLARQIWQLEMLRNVGAVTFQTVNS